MAELLIDAKVTGINQVKDLEKAVKDVEKSTDSLEKEWAGFLTKLGAVTAAAYGLVTATKALIKASDDYNKTSKQIAENLKQQEIAANGWKAALSDVIGLTALRNAHDQAALLGAQRLTAFIRGESLEAIQAEQEMMLEGIDIKEMMGDAVDDYIDKVDEEIKKEKELSDLMQDGYTAAFQWRQSGFEEWQKNAKDAEIEANEKLIEQQEALNKFREQFTNYAAGRNPSAQLWQSTWEGDTAAPTENVAEKLEENTKALDRNSNERGYESPNYATGGAFVPEATPYGARSGSRRDFYTPTGGSWGLKGKERPSWYGSQHFTGTLQGPKDYAAQARAQEDRAQAARDKGEQERYAEALEEATQALEAAYTNLDKWTDFLILSQNILAEVNSGLKDMVSNLQSLQFNDYYSQAREALYGGTDKSLGYEEAKANAEAAWNIYQTDTWNEEYLNSYNDRMDDLIGTLEDFSDTTKYVSSQEQDFAKATALYEIGLMQDVQDEQKSDIDKQIELLEKMVELSEVQNDATDAANNILDHIELETKEGKDATYLVQDAVDDVELATKQVELANAEIELKKTEKFNLQSTRWTQTGQSTYQVWTGESSGVGQKVYETVTEPTFGYVTESGEQIGFRGGGYTGNMPTNDIAGTVHGQEYVLNADTTNALGLNDSGSTGVFAVLAARLAAIEELTYEILKTDKRSLVIQTDSNDLLAESNIITGGIAS